jgi:DNA-nicking Smr family endonuclease
MSARVSERLFSLLLKAAFIFEPLAPRAISYYLTRRMREWKRQGLISEYKTRTRRLGKFHYKIEVDLGLTSKQAHTLLVELLPKQQSVRRWLNV